MKETSAVRVNVRRNETGQTLIIFVLALTAIIGFMAMAIDVGIAFHTRRQEQASADSAALAGAQAMAATGNANAAITEANNYLQKNGYTSGNSTISVNIPPTSGSHSGDSSYIQVSVSKNEAPVFRAPLTNSLWAVSASAVAHVVPKAAVQSPYNFIALRDDCQSHTLLINAGGTLTVNGGIYVNSCNGLDGSGKGSVPPGYGDAFDIFGVGGHIQAQSVHVVGGWETHDGTTVSPDPLIHQPVIADPAAGLAYPDINTLTTRYGTAAAPSQYHINTNTTITLQPGVYYGGILIDGSNNPKVTLADGIYYMAGGGFQCSGTCTVTGNHVLIFNTSTPKKSAADVNLTGKSVTLGPPTFGPYAGMTIFQNRAVNLDLTIGPQNGISGLSGTIYSANKDSVAVVTASGTANLQLMTGMINIVGADATFQFQGSGLYSSSYSAALVE